MRRQDIPQPLLAGLGAHASGRLRRLSYAPAIMEQARMIAAQTPYTFAGGEEVLRWLGGYGMARIFAEVGMTRGVTQQGCRIGGDVAAILAGDEAPTFAAQTYSALQGEAYTYRGAPITAHRAATAIKGWVGGTQ